MTFLARMALVWPVAVVMHLTPCAEKKHPSREQRCDNLTMRRRASGSIDRLLPPGAAYCDQQPRGILKLLDLRGREPESGLRISARHRSAAVRSIFPRRSSPAAASVLR